MNDRNTRQILTFKDYCSALEQVKQEFQDQSTRADNEGIKRGVAAEMKKTRTR